MSTPTTTPASPTPDTPAADAPGKAPGKPPSGRRNALLERLMNEFPVFKEFRPLAIGIHKQLLERWPDLDKAEMRTALRNHTAATRYLKALEANAPRFDLDGNPAGSVTAEQQTQAVTTLRERMRKAAERRKAEQAAQAAEAEARERQAKLEKLADKFKRS